MNQETDHSEAIRRAAQLILKQDITHLPLVPVVALKLLKLTNDENARIEDLSKIIETDPGLSVKILRNVNSAHYSLPHKVTAIKRAVSVLGFSLVRQQALNLLFYDKLIKQKPKQAFKPLFFWQHCLFVASLSRIIAASLNHPDPDLVYTAGLLHDIGKVVLETYGHLSYSDFIQAGNNSGFSMLEEERCFFGITHTEIGYIFCLEWRLPPVITAVVAGHHEDLNETSQYAEFNTEIAIVSFANYIAWMQGLSSVPNHSRPLLQPAVLKIIDLEQLDIEDLLQRVDQEMQNTREFYGIQFPNLNKLRATLVKSTIRLSQLNTEKFQGVDNKSNQKLLYSLTIPHRSLNPDDFVPKTLEAVQAEFAFDRCVLLGIDPKRRSLLASYYRPDNLPPMLVNSFELNIGNVSGRFLKCLREKEAVIINHKIEPDNQLIQQLKVAEFIAVPVLNHNQLIAVLYADYAHSQKPLPISLLSELLPITNELGIALYKAKQFELQKKHAQLDPLTQLNNRRMIDNYLTQLFQGDKAKLLNLAVGFIDIDKFKQFNDLCGHLAGDDALKIVADILRNLTRPGDFIGRYGGEEFLFVLKNTHRAGAFSYAERIRTSIERRGKIMSQRFNNQLLTASIGVALYKPCYLTHAEMIEAADQAMYQAKRGGRNRIVLLTHASDKAES